MGATIQIHGPHGHFVLQEPITDSIFVATGTGVAPMRAYLQWLFPAGGADRSQGKDIWLVYGTRYESDIYYRAEFEALAESRPQLPLPAHAEPRRRYLEGPAWTRTGPHCEDRRRARQTAGPIATRRARRSGDSSRLRYFDIYCYICGLNFMVSSVRELLDGYGWHKKQVVFERYD